MVLGKVHLTCHHKNRSVNTEFFVVESAAVPLLSLKTSLDLQLIELTFSVNKEPGSLLLNKSDVMQEHGELFKGIGLFPGTCSLHLIDNAVPVICPRGKFRLVYMTDKRGS